MSLLNHESSIGLIYPLYAFQIALDYRVLVERCLSGWKRVPQSGDCLRFTDDASKVRVQSRQAVDRTKFFDAWSMWKICPLDCSALAGRVM